MNNEYYTVSIAIKGNMVVGTGLEVVRDFAMPHNKTWFRDEYTFKEKSFENYEEAQSEQEKWDRFVGINFDDYFLSTYITNETHVKQMREANTIFKTRGEANFECMYCNNIYDLKHVVCRVKYKNKWGDWKFAGYYVALENDDHIKEV